MTGQYNIEKIPYYPDEGCEFSPSCLECPLPRCILDEPGTRRQLKKRNRNEQIIRRFKKGESISDLAKAFGISKRTIQRAVRDGLRSE